MKHFNTAGPCNPEDHYMLPAASRLPELRRLIDQKAYFVIHKIASGGSGRLTTATLENFTAEEVAALYHQHTTETVKTGAEWTAKPVWHNPDVAMYMNSPVLDGEVLYGMSHKRKGQYFCLEAATGKTLWATEGREGVQASVIGAKDVLLLLSADGNLIVARKDLKAFTQLAKYTVTDSPAYAHPVVFGKHLLVKDDASMILWSFE
jgi:outer membrane protein assembly factor BamB